LIRLEKEHFAISFIFAGKLDSGDKITIMVSKKIVSLHGAELPEAGQRREIKGGPLYDRGHVLELLDKEKNIQAWTRKCRDDLQNWGLDPEDIVELISMSLSEGNFLGSQWCEQEENGPWAACDAYSIFRLEWSEAAHRKISTEYYVKFAINKTGKLLLIVSCHPSSFR